VAGVILFTASVPGNAKKRPEQSETLKACVTKCKSEKDTTAHEDCLIKCAKADDKSKAVKGK
jgi:hypothetical protein